MGILTLLVQWRAEALARIFTSEPGVIAVCSLFLRYMSWNFVAVHVIFTCSALFQAMGNTWPSMGSMAIRLVTFAVPTVWLAHQPGFQPRHAFTLSVVTVLVQAVVSYAWLRREFRTRLDGLQRPAQLPPDSVTS